MGLALIATGSDFSGISIGNLGLLPSVGTLTHVFETRLNAATARRNNVTTALEGTVFGSPTFDAVGMQCDETKGVSFGTGQTGNSSVAIVCKNTTTPTVDSLIVGAFPSAGSALTSGGGYFISINSGDLIRYETTSHVGTASSSGTITASLSAPLGNAYELFVATLNDAVGLTLYHPRTGASVLTALPAGRTFQLPVQTPYAATSPNSNSNVEEVLMFAKWASVLTNVQVATLYTEVKDYYADFGVTL